MKKSVIRLYLILCLVSGIVMGSIFPVFASFFMKPKSSDSEIIFTIGCVIAGIGVGLISYFIGKVTLLKTIGKLNQCFDRISNGDFNFECEIQSDDAIGRLVDSLGGMKRSLAQLISDIACQSGGIDTIVKANKEELVSQNQRVTQIHALAESVSSEMEKVAEITGTLHDTSMEIETAVKSIADKALEGTEFSESILNKANEANTEITESVRRAEALLNGTSHKLEKAIADALVVDEINVLLESILKISGQTNLLALNAAIESSRAGGDGKGFSVIAKEIRALSETSKSNAEQISLVVHNVVDAVKELVVCSRELLTFISENVNKDYEKFTGVVEEYSSNSRFLDDLVTDFSGTSEELFASLQTVFDQVQEIAGAAQNNAQSVSQIFEEIQALGAESAELVTQTGRLDESSGYLKDSISKFNL